MRMLRLKTFLHDLQTKRMGIHTSYNGTIEKTVEIAIAKQLQVRKVAFSTEIKLSR